MYNKKKDAKVSINGLMNLSLHLGGQPAEAAEFCELGGIGVVVEQMKKFMDCEPLAEEVCNRCLLLFFCTDSMRIPPRDFFE